MRRRIIANISASLYFCLLCCLSGCSTEEAAENTSNKSEVLVTVNLNETSWNTGQSIAQTKVPVAEASIPVEGGVLTATLEPSTDAQTRSTDISNGGDYWNWRVLSPTDNTNYGSEYEIPLIDPCKKVAPAGTWRMPKKEEFDKLVASGYVKAYKNNVLGMYFGTTTTPTVGTEKKYVFLPAAGKRQNNGTATGLFDCSGFYWSATPCLENKAYCLEIATSFSIAGVDYLLRTDGYSVRCVSEQ